MIIITKNRRAAELLASQAGETRQTAKIYTDKEQFRGLNLVGHAVFALFAGGEMDELIEQAIAQRGTVYRLDDSPMREFIERQYRGSKL